MTAHPSERVISHEDAAFERYRELYAHGTLPTLVVQAETAVDVVAAIKIATDRRLAVSVLGGGHTHALFTVGVDHLLIDLEALNVISVDGRRVHIGGGATWGAVAAALTPHGLAISSGDTTSVGVGGLTLGGGVGWLVRHHGLALDSLVEAEIVTASGAIVTASNTSEPELFWAIRGGGGNFGVVTRFTFVAHPLAGVVGGKIMFREENLEQLLRAWRDCMRAASDELNTTFLASPPMGPDMPGGYVIHCCYPGDDVDAAMSALAPLLELDGMQSHDLARRAYSELLVDNEDLPDDIVVASNNAFAREFTDELIDALASAHRSISARLNAVLMIRSLGGAFARVPADATAFAHRDAEVLIISAAMLPADAAGYADTVHSAWAPVVPHTEGGYGNFFNTVGPEVLGSIYPPGTLQRLARAKALYDPGNVFRCNHNVEPTA